MLYTIGVVMLVLWVLGLIIANSSLELFKLALGNLGTQQTQIDEVKIDIAKLRKLRRQGRMGNSALQIKSNSKFGFR